MADSYSPELPEPIIHRIQSLLTHEKAAETTLLTKSWHSAWSTRPTIDLVECVGLPELATKKFQMYEESNLRIDTFRLYLYSERCFGRLPAEWTLKALKLGATDITFRFGGYNSPDGILLGELLGSETVARLCLEFSNIRRLKVITKCSPLKSLALRNVYMSKYSLFNIFSSCPLIENLSLSNVYCIWYDTPDDDYYYGDLYDRHDRRRQVVPSDLVTGLHKLTSLVMFLSDTRLEEMFLYDMSNKFPNLKDLTLRLCFFSSDKKITKIISSRSVEILNFSVYGHDTDMWLPRVKFDVPRIRKFTYVGSSMPEMPALTYQWESRVSITQHAQLSTTWFLQLRNLLISLRSSEIHLFLHVHNKISSDYRPEEIKCSNVVEVENLTMDTKGLPSLQGCSNVFLDGLFRICRPKIIDQYLGPHPDDRTPFDDVGKKNMSYDYGGSTVINNDLSLCRALEQGLKLRSSLIIPSQHMYGLCLLEEINAEMLSDGVWRTQPLDSILSDDSTIEQRSFRLQLKWKPPN